VTESSAEDFHNSAVAIQTAWAFKYAFLVTRLARFNAIEPHHAAALWAGWIFQRISDQRTVHWLKMRQTRLCVDCQNLLCAQIRASRVEQQMRSISGPKATIVLTHIITAYRWGAELSKMRLPGRPR